MLTHVIHTHKHAYIHIYTHIYIYIYITYTHTCIYIHIFIYLFIYIYINISNSSANRHTHIHKYIHAYIHTYILTCRPSHYIQVPFDSSFVCEITSTGKNARNAGRDVGFVRDRHPEVSQKLSHFLPPGQTRFIQLELCPEECISIPMIL